MKVIKAGCRVLSGHSYISQQMFYTHRYRNDTIARTRELRRREHEWLLTQVPELAAIQTDLDIVEQGIKQIYADVKLRSQRSRRYEELTPDEETQLTALKARQETLSRRYWSTVKPALEAARAAVDAARKLISGGYQQIEDEAARREGRKPIKKKLKDNDDWRRALADDEYRVFADIEWDRSQSKNAMNKNYGNLEWLEAQWEEYCRTTDNPRLPPCPTIAVCSGSRGFIDASLKPKKNKPEAYNFKAWDGSGILSAKVKKTWGEILAGRSNVLRVELRNNRTILHITSHLRERMGFSVQTRWDINDHRIDDSCKVTDVTLIRRRVGQTTKFSIHLTTETIDQHVVPKTGVCAVDIGWRKLDSGLRVAMVTGMDDNDEPKQLQLIIPQEWLDKQAYNRELQSRRDDAFNRITERIRAMHEESPVPDEVIAASRVQCRSTAKLSSALWHWEDRPEELEQWRKQNKLMENEQRFGDLKIQRRREDLYRNFARYVATYFNKVALENIDWSKMRTNPHPGEKQQPRATKYHRNIAAPGILAKCIKDAVADRERLVLRDPKYTSQTCLICGVVTDPEDQLVHTCQGCQGLLDVDALASTGMALATARELEDQEAIRTLEPFKSRSDIQVWRHPNRYWRP